MKKSIIGGFISLIGAMGNLSVFVAAADNMLSGWSTPPGRLLSTINETGMSLFMVFSCLLIIIGLIIMGIEFFKKEYS